MLATELVPKAKFWVTATAFIVAVIDCNIEKGSEIVVYGQESITDTLKLRVWLVVICCGTALAEIFRSTEVPRRVWFTTSTFI